MNKTFVLLPAAVLTLAACGGGSGSSDQKAALSQLSAIQSAQAQASGAAGSNASNVPTDLSSILAAASSASSVPSADASQVDVCALLSPTDAQSVAMADNLDGAQTASTVYKLTTTKDTSQGPNRSACRFDISSGGAEGTVLFIVKPGPEISYYTGDTKLDGLGDEAYTGAGGGTVVRVGGLLLDEGDDSFSNQMTIDLLRKMVPNLKP